jgi:hypothetical protein
MILCFIFGGFSLIFYTLQVYSAFWQTDLVPILRGESTILPASIISNESREGNISEFNRRNTASMSSFSTLFSPFSVILLSTGIVSVLGGFSIWNLVRKSEIKSTKKAILDVFLLPEEKRVMDEIEKHGGSLKQNEIVRNTGLSKVKVHRVIKNLEKKNLLQKQEYGMTNIVVLKK